MDLANADLGNPSEPLLDVAIIGGSFAGLAAATTLGRSLRRVAVFDSGAPRNAPSPSAHNVFGNDGASPAALLEAGRRDAARYGVPFHATRVAAIRRLEPSEQTEGAQFAVVLDEPADGQRQVRARRLLLATGLRDELPDIDGLAEHWGTQVLHCPYCHGWEVRGQRIAVIGTHPMATHQALLFAQLSPDLTLITHNMELSAQQRAEMDAAGVRVVEGRIRRVLAEEGRITAVLLENDDVVPVDALTVQSRMIARGELFEGLGGTLAEHPMGGRFIEVDARGATQLPGIWAAGNVTDLAATVQASAAAGVNAGAQLNMDLIQEDLAARMRPLSA